MTTVLRRRIISVPTLNLLVGLLLFVSSSSVQSTKIDTKDITVFNTIHIERVDLDSREEIHLISLATHPDGGAVAYELYWSKDHSGWFPTWELHLASELDLLPVALTPKRSGDRSWVVLADPVPVAGHTYEVAVAYAPEAGMLELRLYDLTSDILLYADGYSVLAAELPVYAASGDVHAGYIPVATHWRVGILNEDERFLALHHFRSRDESAIIQIQRPPVSAAGEYRVYYVPGPEEADVLIGSFVQVAGEHRLPLNLAQFPLGTSVLRFDYVDDGSVVFSETTSISLGRVDFWLRPLRPDRDQGVVVAELLVQSGGPYPEDFTVDVHAALYEMVWDQQTRTFQDVLYQEWLIVKSAALDLSTGETSLTIELPFPELRANWKVVLSPEIRPDVSMQISDGERLFSSHLPATVHDDEPYTIAVFPDTQAMTQHFPDVLTRMTDWVTAYAAEYNIAAALHVGDITNHDTGPQWANAYRSLSLLHGVVPYVLTLGNHDMTGGRGTGGDVKARGMTLINEFFSVEEAIRYSRLAGTMVPGRLENHYHLFTIGRDRYVVIALEFGPPDEAIAWADTIAKQYPDHRLIVLTHSYTTTGGGLSRNPSSYDLGSNPDTTVNTAPEIWAKLLEPNANSFMVVSGHTAPSVPTVPYRVPRSKTGRPVFELLFDWQNQPTGGNGWLGLLTFHPDNTLEVRVYSPYLDEFSLAKDAYGYSAHMTFDLESGAVRHH